MSDEQIYRGRGSDVPYQDLMDFINYVFGGSDPTRDLRALLPKIFEPQHNPSAHNFVVIEDNKVKATAGLYSSSICIGTEELHCGGVGNVAVHPYSRSKGYMKSCMNMALDEMIKQDIDFSILSGQRQRYQYFGYENVGVIYKATINESNLRHVFREESFNELEIKELSEDDIDLMNEIVELHSSRKIKVKRPVNEFYNIATSWKSQIRAYFKNNELLGYLIDNNREIRELTLADSSYFNDIIRNDVKEYGKFTLTIPSWDKAMLNSALLSCESLSLHTSDMYNIFNYEKVVRSLLKLKTQVERLADGELKVYIHGYKADVKLKLTVKDNTSEVSVFDGDCDIELSHLDAMSLIFGIYSPFSEKLEPFTKSWFPLPLHIEPSDNV